MKRFSPNELKGKRYLVVGGNVYDLGAWVHPGPFLEPFCNGTDASEEFDKVHDRARLKGLKCIGVLEFSSAVDEPPLADLNQKPKRFFSKI